jgi:hypothetical protein
MDALCEKLQPHITLDRVKEIGLVAELIECSLCHGLLWSTVEFVEFLPLFWKKFFPILIFWVDASSSKTVNGDNKNRFWDINFRNLSHFLRATNCIRRWVCLPRYRIMKFLEFIEPSILNILIKNFFSKSFCSDANTLKIL